MKNNMLLHIPHSSTYIPEDLLGMFTVSKETLDHELLVMTDRYTDELFDCSDNRIVFPVSRLICDVERFREKDMETMTSKGMWVCYENTSELTPLKRVSREHASCVLEHYYDMHHKALTEAAAHTKDLCGNVLIIDCHSFSPLPLPYEDDRTADRPDICIGTDDFHTPRTVSDTLVKAFSEMGYRVSINSPYSGSLVPMAYWRRDPSVMSVMIEVNRKLYMDGTTGEKLKRFNTVRDHIGKALSLCYPMI